MKKPKMILFDYGHTLLCEPDFDGVNGNRALLEYATSNPNNLSAEDISKFADELFWRSSITKAREIGVESHNFMFDKLLYEYLQIEFSISSLEMERVFWDNCAPGEAMDNIDKVLDYLNENNIRTGVISNISYSGAGLKNRIDRLLQNNNFEFVIASSEYIVRKPDPLIFELALRKAKLSAGEVWYCGDNTKLDVYGANNVGIFPVWYHSLLPCDYRDKSLDVKPECEHLYINDWMELINILEGLK